MNLPWCEMVSEIHAKGLPWKLIGSEIGAAPGTVRKFVAGTGMTITFERGMRILKLYATFYPDRFTTKIRPLIARLLGAS